MGVIRSQCLSLQPARTRTNPRKHAVSGKKMASPRGSHCAVWWSRGELNPRPSIVFMRVFSHRLALGAKSVRIFIETVKK